MNRVAFVTGAGGQDGSFLAELLISKGYSVHGLIRRSSTFNTSRIDHIFDKITLHYGDLSDAGSLRHIIAKIKPDEIYHLAAQSHVRVSFDQPEYTVDVIALGTLRLLEAMRDLCPDARFYNAASSELFGSSPPPQNELTPFHPRSPYACGKAAAFYEVVNYREAYNLFAVNGILMNHESPRRGETFVTRKITRAVSRIKYGLQNEIYLGNIDSFRDWGYAKEFVSAMFLMLQQNKPEDYVIATGESHSVREFLELSFKEIGMNWTEAQTKIKFDPRLYRPTEVDHLRGDASKAEKILNWKPTIKFHELVKIMMEHDLAKAKEEYLMSKLR